MIQDVIQRQQAGATVKLYIDQVFVSGAISEALSRSLTVPVILTSANLNINPDDAQMVEVAFLPAGTPTFDFSKSA
jgi:hypothetical protein